MKTSKPVKTFQEYLALPKQERYKLGLYLAPNFEESDMLDSLFENMAFWDWARENHPFQYFLRITVVDSPWTIKRRLQDAYWRIRGYLWDKHHLVKISSDPTWHDTDFKMEKALEVLFLAYVEKELDGKIPKDDEYSEGRYAKISSIYDFFKVTKPALEAEIEAKMDKLYNSNYFSQRYTEEFAAEHKKLGSLEAALNAALTDNLIEIVKIRATLWT